ncbi:ribonuclease H, partial [Trifolium pratense]
MCGLQLVTIFGFGEINLSLTLISLDHYIRLDNWICINTDGALQNGVVGSGGVIRDQFGKWIVDFAKKVGHASAYIAEFWGAYEGLKLARSRGFMRIDLRIDSLVVVQSLKGEQVEKLIALQMLWLRGNAHWRNHGR